jgi:hypothetical protein
MGLNQTGWEDLDWIHLAQGSDRWPALVNKTMNLWVPLRDREVAD